MNMPMETTREALQELILRGTEEGAERKENGRWEHKVWKHERDARIQIRVKFTNDRDEQCPWNVLGWVEGDDMFVCDLYP